MPNHTENKDFVSTAEKRNDEVYDRILPYILDAEISGIKIAFQHDCSAACSK